MVRNTVFQIKAAEPTVSQVQMYLFTEPPLGPDAKAVSHEKHADQQFRINRWAAVIAVEVCEMSADTAQINEPINRPQQVI